MDVITANSGNEGSRGLFKAHYRELESRRFEVIGSGFWTLQTRTVIL